MPDSNDRPIVLAYDGSDSARAAVEKVADLVSARPVLVVSAWSSLAESARASLVAIPAEAAHNAGEALDRAAEQRAAALAEEAAERLRRLGMDATSTARHGEWNAWITIVDFADEHDASLVVLGSRGLSGIKSMLLGSTSTAVLHHSSRPVLIVPPPVASAD